MFKFIEDLDVKILASDVGAFTQDIVFWTGTYERSFKMILPSPTVILAEKVTILTKEKKDIVFTGETMGGGPLNRSIQEHIAAGLKVYMTEKSARTFRDDLDLVKSSGIAIIEESGVEDLRVEDNTEVLVTGDLDVESIRSAAGMFGLRFEPEVVAMGVEDHGTHTDKKSDREIRFDIFESHIPSGIEKFGFEEPPEYFTRMVGVKNTLSAEFPESKHLVMDSKIAAVFGAAFGKDEDKLIVVDVGNGHTTAGSFEKGVLTGLFEHHTHMLTADKITSILKDFADGTLTNEEIFNDGGHGCYISKPVEKADIVVTGPMRSHLFEETDNVKFVNPSGDVMITGNVGLIECARKKYSH